MGRSGQRPSMSLSGHVDDHLRPCLEKSGEQKRWKEALGPNRKPHRAHSDGNQL